MISTALARELREAGLRWTPTSGDAFQIALPDFEGDQFTVSDMTIEAHDYPTGAVLGFNGTTEWALDSVALGAALWLPREDQLRELLRGTFRSLLRAVDTEGRVSYTVTVRIGEVDAAYSRDDPSEAYGVAVLALIRSAA
ncbi:pilus assembly protein CpaE [Lysinimonas soli]|uniref:Pilus assembly protein CpaE n=1 Tax=Lysinimonas soli TaxID=1074233 RepID=A0ABW0NN16_9MICO